MAGIWVYSEDDAVLYQLLAIGRKLADSLGEALVAMGFGEENAAQWIARGADQAVFLEGNGSYPESYAKAITGVAAERKPRLLLIGGTRRGKETAAKVAAWLEAGLVNSAFCIEVVEGAVETERILYGGLAVCREILAPGAVVTVEPRTYEAAEVTPGRGGTTEKIAVQAENSVAVGSVCPRVKQGADITAAEKIVCVGRGVGKQEDMELVKALAAKMGAEIGCTRSIAEDYHWLPNETYIGLSGQKVKPQIYLSLGVSGQVQHTAGIRDSKLIIAVDANENAPIFAAADYGIVGDLYEIVPLLLEKIGK